MGVEVLLHSFLNSTLGGREWSALRQTKTPPISAEQEAVWGSERVRSFWRSQL